MNTSETSTLKIIAPPPVLYVVAMSLGCIMHVVTTARIYGGGYLLLVLGMLIFIASAVFARWSFDTMKRAKTSASPREPSTNLTTSGPFQYSRNPIYVAMTGLYVGFTLLLNAIWPLIILIPLLLVMQWGVILREEQYLSTRFGQEYINYKKNVRRWL